MRLDSIAADLIDQYLQLDEIEVPGYWLSFKGKVLEVRNGHTSEDSHINCIRSNGHEFGLSNDELRSLPSCDIHQSTEEVRRKVFDKWIRVFFVRPVMQFEGKVRHPRFLSVTSDFLFSGKCPHPAFVGVEDIDKKTRYAVPYREYITLTNFRELRIFER